MSVCAIHDEARTCVSVDLRTSGTGWAHHRVLQALDELRRGAMRLLAGADGAFAGYEGLELSPTRFEDDGHLRLIVTVFDATESSFHAKFDALYAEPCAAGSSSSWMSVAHGHGRIVAIVGSEKTDQAPDPGSQNGEQRDSASPHQIPVGRRMAADENEGGPIPADEDREDGKVVWTCSK